MNSLSYAFFNWFKESIRNGHYAAQKLHITPPSAGHPFVEGGLTEEIDMSQPDQDHPSSDPMDDPNEAVPFMQQLLDNPFLLLFLGVMIPMIVYTLWGVIDILTVPLAK